MTPLAAAVFSALHPASQALAQEAQPAETRLESVTVTATRRSENLQNVAQSVTALTTEFIQKQALKNTYDLIGALPSVNFVSYVPGQSTIVMRGIGTGTGEYRIDSKVSVYLDDQPMTAISQQADVRLIDIERVEALPGPQGTLFGSSAQTGTLHYVTNKPDISGFSSEVSTEIGTTEGGDPSYDVNGWLNYPVSDNFALRVVGFWSEEGGYVDNVPGRDLMDSADNADVVEDDQNVYRTTGGRVSGLWTINEDWSLLTTGIYQRGDTMGTWETDPFLGDNKTTRFFDEYRDDEWYTASATLKGNLGFAELSLTGSYFDRRIDYQWDNTNYVQYQTYYYTSGDDPAAYALYDRGQQHATTFNWQKQERWAYEARLTSQGDSRLQWMAGAFFEDVWDWWEYGADVPGLVNTPSWDKANENCLALDPAAGVTCPLAPTSQWYYEQYDNTVKQLAFFGEMTYDLTDKWSVTGGARWFEFDRDRFEIYQVPRGLPAESDPDANGLTSASTDSDTTFKLATRYQLSPDVMLYALYSEGFRLGGDNSPRAADTGLVPATYGPDYLENYELGIKSEWFDHRLLLNASLFLMEWDDIQLRLDNTDDGNNGAWWLEGNFNGGKAEQKGVEFNGQWIATDRLNFEWSVFLGNPEFTEDTLYPNTTEIYVAKGTTMPVSPEEKYWASVEYTFPDFLPLQGDLWTRFSYTWQGEVWDSLGAIEDFEDAETPEEREEALEFLIPEWKSGTFQLGFTSESGWDTALIVRNVFDDAGYSYLSQSDYGSLFDDPRWRYVRNLQRPRSYNLSFTKRW
jgi:outer membrane receptor protein involved in Fe transport